MKRIALVLLLACSGCQSFRERVAWATYPGAMKYGHCAEYAGHVASDLQKKGTEAYYVEYTWYRDDCKKKTGRHAIVVFQKGGEWFIVDNERAYPKKVHKGTLSEMVKEFAPNMMTVHTELSLNKN